MCSSKHYQIGQMSQTMKMSQEAVGISLREHVGLLLSVCALNILPFYSQRESNNSLLCHKILFIDLVA